MLVWYATGPKEEAEAEVEVEAAYKPLITASNPNVFGPATTVTVSICTQKSMTDLSSSCEQSMAKVIAVGSYLVSTAVHWYVLAD